MLTQPLTESEQMLLRSRPTWAPTVWRLLFNLRSAAYFYVRMAKWATTVSEYENVGLVAGATRPEHLARIRSAAGDVPLLIPGVGAQAGDLAAAVAAVSGSPYLINASRSITGASVGLDFADAAADAAARLHQDIEQAEGAVVRT
jgi:orotidine-5'-phosphate decarboxylase